MVSASFSAASSLASASATFCSCWVRNFSNSAFCRSTSCSASFFRSICWIRFLGRSISRIRTCSTTTPLSLRESISWVNTPFCNCSWVSSRKKSSARAMLFPCSRTIERTAGVICTESTCSAKPVSSRMRPTIPPSM